MMQHVTVGEIRLLAVHLVQRRGSLRVYGQNNLQSMGAGRVWDELILEEKDEELDPLAEECYTPRHKHILQKGEQTGSCG